LEGATKVSLAVASPGAKVWNSRTPKSAGVDFRLAALPDREPALADALVLASAAAFNASAVLTRVASSRVIFGTIAERCALRCAAATGGFLAAGLGRSLGVSVWPNPAPQKSNEAENTIKEQLGLRHIIGEPLHCRQTAASLDSRSTMLRDDCVPIKSARQGRCAQTSTPFYTRQRLGISFLVSSEHRRSNAIRRSQRSAVLPAPRATQLIWFRGRDGRREGNIMFGHLAVRV
jgi:hypothetical protein